MIKRITTLTRRYSFFLFGARGTGKSSLVKSRYPAEETYYIDLLDPEAERKYSMHPQLLLNEVLALPEHIRYVIIDEVQKLPELLSLVHKLLETPCHQYFILTGSSARKLKKAGVDLLAGRAFVFHLFPFSYIELGDRFSLAEALAYGTLPKIYEFDDPTDKVRFLNAYTQTYLKEEVWAEHIIKNLAPFRRFLEVAAQSNGGIINYHKIARDVGIDDKTVQNYFSILEDTLVGHVIEPFQHSFRKRLSAKPKFYFFDTGVVRSLANLLDVSLKPGTSYYGEVFEHYIILECIRLNQYYELGYRFSYLATPSGLEIDLVVERPNLRLLLLEIKSTTLVTEAHVRQLKTISKDLKNTEAVLLSQDKTPKVFGNIKAMHWRDALTTLLTK